MAGKDIFSSNSNITGFNTDSDFLELEMDAELATETSIVDPEIAKYVPQFVASRRSELNEMRAELTLGNFDKLVKVGHNLKGISRPYGFPQLEVLGRRLELIAAEKDLNGCHRLLDQIESILGLHFE